MHELLTQLFAVAALQARERIYQKHGAFMPPDEFKTVEQINQLLFEAGWFDGLGDEAGCHEQLLP